MVRGTGGLVTALTGLASYRPLVWIASAMTDAVSPAFSSSSRFWTVRASSLLPGAYLRYFV